MQAFFDATADGYRFCLLRQPPDDVAPRGAIVFIQPFAEEMNKSRRMAALGARALAAAGFTTLQLDLRGCGDSSGDFGEASWNDWIADVLRAIDHVRGESSLPCWLWALRAGALLVPAVVEQRPQMNVLLWQPVVSGQQHLTQFLRLKAAAGIIGTSAGASTQVLKAKLAAGESVEVAGYRLAPALANGLAAAELKLPAGFGGRIDWFEVSNEADASLSLPAQQRVDALRAAGVRVQAEVVKGEPFWQTVEITDCEPLIERTVACLSEA